MDKSTPAPKPRVQGSRPAPKLEEGEKESGVVWELRTGQQVTLQLKNLDNGSHFTVIIQEGVSFKSIPDGHWELTGFEENGKSFVSMNSTKKFIFRMKKKAVVYAGSIVTGCPVIDPRDLRLLKSMKFFNRYPFSSSLGLCEMVIGNDYESVKALFSKAHKNKKLKLTLGF